MKFYSDIPSRDLVLKVSGSSISAAAFRSRDAFGNAFRVSGKSRVRRVLYD